jgi:hypothetical protein
VPGEGSVVAEWRLRLHSFLRDAPRTGPDGGTLRQRLEGVPFYQRARTLGIVERRTTLLSDRGRIVLRAGRPNRSLSFASGVVTLCRLWLRRSACLGRIVPLHERGEKNSACDDGRKRDDA